MYSKRRLCAAPLAKPVRLTVRSVYAPSATAGSGKLATMVPSTLTFSTSVKGDETVPIRIWKVRAAVEPAAMVTVCPRVAVSTAGRPPNHAQMSPANGGDAPPPVLQLAASHKRSAEVGRGFRIPERAGNAAGLEAAVHDDLAAGSEVGRERRELRNSHDRRGRRRDTLGSQVAGACARQGRRRPTLPVEPATAVDSAPRSAAAPTRRRAR